MYCLIWNLPLYGLDGKLIPLTAAEMQTTCRVTNVLLNDLEVGFK